VPRLLPWCHSISFEIVAEIDFTHHGLLASKSGKKAYTNPRAIQLSIWCVQESGVPQDVRFTQPNGVNAPHEPLFASLAIEHRFALN
tara:strand:+ start:1658 stop:1918 length:261 start_codon:yes stop_codon:yes gene_type:complete